MVEADLFFKCSWLTANICEYSKDDTKKRKQKQISNTPTLPFIEWLAFLCIKQEEKDKISKAWFHLCLLEWHANKPVCSLSLNSLLINWTHLHAYIT